MRKSAIEVFLFSRVPVFKRRNDPPYQLPDDWDVNFGFYKSVGIGTGTDYGGVSETKSGDLFFAKLLSGTVRGTR